MKIKIIQIENFLCHEYSHIDFDDFNSALIVAKVNNNDMYSNGAGKSTIFGAIEYVLFNQAEINLEKVIRDDTNVCKVVLYLDVDNNLYRISRSRNRKGTTDLSLHIRNYNEGNDTDIFNFKKPNELYWKDLTGRRSADTESEIEKIIKINFKSFRQTVHFAQNDFSGLTTATPSNRKALLKEVLNLGTYAKLEKIAKEKFNILSKEIEKYKILLEPLSNLENEKIDLINKLNQDEKSLKEKEEEKEKALKLLNNEKEILSSFIKEKENFISNNKLLLEKKIKLVSEIENLTESYSTYKNNSISLVKQAKVSANELTTLKNEIEKLLLENIEDSIQSHQSNLNEINQKIIKLELENENLLKDIKELQIPLPEDNKCLHCRQNLSEEHKIECQKNIDDKLFNFKNLLNTNNSNIIILSKDKKQAVALINSFAIKQKELETKQLNLTNLQKDLESKKQTYKDYNSILETLNKELESKKINLQEINKELESVSYDDFITKIDDKITNQNLVVNSFNDKFVLINKNYTHLNSLIAVVKHQIEKNEKDQINKNTYLSNIENLEEKYKKYPSVIEAFSSTGIPNLIVQNCLDDLQYESNNILNQLKPGMQLNFLVEKKKSDGNQDDTLDIKYFVNGREREYNQMSGAMKLAVTFSLKMGLSFLLQKLFNIKMEFLLLDEIDQSLDKAGADAFVDIVKFLQKELKVLVITHNDRLKDKFSHAILVEQDSNMVSKAKVVTSW